MIIGLPCWESSAIMNMSRCFEKLERVSFILNQRFSNVVIAHSSWRRLPTAWTRMKSRGCWNPRIYRCCTSYQPSAASRRTMRRVASRRLASHSLIRCVGASWRRVTNDNAAVTSNVRDAVSLTLRNGEGMGKGERSAVAHG